MSGPDTSEPATITVLGIECERVGRGQWRGSRGSGSNELLTLFVARFGGEPMLWTITASRSRDVRAEGARSYSVSTVDVEGPTIEAAVAWLRELLVVERETPRAVAYRPSERDFLIETTEDEPLVIVRPREQRGASMGEPGYLAAEALAQRIARLP